MRRLLQVGLGLWFAIAITLAQACAPANQTADPPSTTKPLAQLGSVGKNSGAADPASAVGDPPFDARGYHADQGESQALTHYLKAHRLPLVGAQVLDGSGSKRAVVLYGFVGTDFGKSDASAKAQRFLADPSVVVDNRINIRPELLASGGASTRTPRSPSRDAESEAANSSYPGADSYVQEQNQNHA